MSAFVFPEDTVLDVDRVALERYPDAVGVGPLVSQNCYFPHSLALHQLTDESGRPLNMLVLNWALERAEAENRVVFIMQLHRLPEGRVCLCANGLSGDRYGIIRKLGVDGIRQDDAVQAARQIAGTIGRSITLFPTGDLVTVFRGFEGDTQITYHEYAYPPSLAPAKSVEKPSNRSTYLKRLEAESIHVIREAVAEAENPVMLYSIGKDSSVMLHLARKAFFPGAPPFPLLHIDTRWKFQEMYLFRDRMAKFSGMELLVHINPEAIAKDINPFDHGSALHTDITKTVGLRQALDQYKFDVAFGGARRDEEKSRSKERIFSFRSAAHRWEPKNQRPEVWSLFNTKKHTGESMRVFPLSNWTELDIWQYIYEEDIPVVPLYFSKKRPVVERNGMLLMIDDSRFRFLPSERIVEKSVRFRTLGCYPLSGAIESAADTLPKVILELAAARFSERQGRAIDSDASASMEKKKHEGYF